jgi:putative DNA primase/helicase
MAGSQIDLAVLRANLISRAAEVATTLLGKPNGALSSRRELRFGNRGSLTVATAGEKAGCWYDHENGAGGDLLRLIQRVRGGDFASAIIDAQKIIGSAPLQITSRSQRRIPAPASSGKNERSNVSFALALWDEAVPIVGTDAARYLDWRHVLKPALAAGDGSLRFHPNCPFKGAARHPCLLALRRDIRSDQPRAIQRTALDQTLMSTIERTTFIDFAEAGGKIARMTLGPKVATAIKLSSDEVVTQGLTIGEGVETVLGGMVLGFTPAWAVGDADNLKNFSVLAGIECLTVLVDHDASGTGQRAAMECSARWTDAGCEVRRVLPNRAGKDFNDIVLARAMA